MIGLKINMEDCENKSQPYLEKSDEAIIQSIRNGDEQAQEYILNKYKPLVKAKSRAYFLIGADREDIIQEGMIGLYKAIRDYRREKNTSFRSFAELCINRQIITAIKAATRQKHLPLNSYVSLNKPVFDNDLENTYIDMIKEESVLNPETVLIGQENKNFIEAQIMKRLSPFETRVLFLYLQGRSYFEISKILTKTEKSIDNALQRIKRKVEKCLNEEEP